MLENRLPGRREEERSSLIEGQLSEGQRNGPAGGPAKPQEQALNPSASE
jgi:hypothetical protein